MTINVNTGSNFYPDATVINISLKWDNSEHYHGAIFPQVKITPAGMPGYSIMFNFKSWKSDLDLDATDDRTLGKMSVLLEDVYRNLRKYAKNNNTVIAGSDYHYDFF